jgi:DNA-binding GntR family transcriptional regulator
MTTSQATTGRVSTKEALANSLREMILLGSLPGGTRLTEIDLAEKYGVSRQSLQGAFSELTRLGLLEQRPHRGVWVRELQSTDIEDLYFVRFVLEAEAVAHVALEPTTWKCLESCVVQLERLSPVTEWSEVIAADWNFHRVTVACVGSRRLSRAHDQLEGETSLSFMRCAPDDDVASVARLHRELLEVIQTGDGDAAVRELRRHLEVSKRAVLAGRDHRSAGSS